MTPIPAPSPNFDARVAPPDMIVLHYTGMVDGPAALARLTDPEAEDPAPAPDTLPTQPAPEAPVEGRAAPEQTGHTSDSPALPQSADAAMQHESVSNAEEPHESDEGEQRHRRSHGTALPE